MKVLMIGRSKSIAFEDLKKYWGEVDFTRPPKIPASTYDLVIAQEPTIRIGPIACLAATLYGAKFVVEVHGGYLRYFTGIQKTISSLILRRADLVRAVNNEIAHQLREMGLKNVLVVPSIYVKTSVFKPVKKHRDRGKVVIYAGRFAPEKNLPLLIKAFKLVLAKEPSAKLMLIGKGPEKPSLLKIIREQGIEERVTLVDKWLSPEELARYYNEAAVFALTSLYEGGPRAICEAGACETPFVSTPVGILPEVVKDGVGGFFVKRREPHELAEKIVTLLQDQELRQEMGENLREIVIQNFEWDKAVRRYAESYLGLLRS